MSEFAPAGMSRPPIEDARDLQAKLYREIGIAAVAAALRFTTQPDPVASTLPPTPRAVDAETRDAHLPNVMAA